MNLSAIASHPKSDTVLILGARGRLGLAAAKAFAAAGWQVLGQLRPGASGPTLPGVRWLALDPFDTTTLASAARDATVVVHALNPVYTEHAWRTQAPALLEAAIAVSQSLGALLVLPGNVYNFGETMPALLHEDSPQAAQGNKGRVRIAMEQRLAKLAATQQLRSVVVRAGDFYGSGTGSFLDQAMAKELPRGHVTLPGPMNVVTPWAYLPDLARTLVQVAQQRDRLPAFERLHFAGHAVTGQQWADALGHAAETLALLPAGHMLRVRHVPWPLLRLAGLVMPSLAALASMRYIWRTPHRLDNRRLLALIGQEPSTPFAQAVRESLDRLSLRPVVAQQPTPFHRAG